MESTEIFLPFIGMLVLTFAVWTHMYVKRLHYIVSNKVNPQDLTTPDKGARLIPDEVSYPANNLRNLFELPVAFYAVCLYLYATGNVDGVYVAAAWLFFGFRVAHSAIHCTVNRVVWRFCMYVVSALALWFMIGRIVVRTMVS